MPWKCEQIFNLARGLVSSEIPWHFYMDVKHSHQVGVIILLENQKEFLTAGYIYSFLQWRTVPISLTNLCQFVNCKPETLYKIVCCFWPKFKILKYFWEVSNHNNLFLWKLIIYEFLTAGYLDFWTTMTVSRNFYSMLKLREFVHYKTKTLFRIVWYFWTKLI